MFTIYTRCIQNSQRRGRPATSLKAWPWARNPAPASGPAAVRADGFLVYIMYIYIFAMASLTLTVAQQRRLNGFQNRCIRQIIGVALAYVSRISNAAVLTTAAYPLATKLLLKRRLQLFGKILRLPSVHPLRVAYFIPSTLTPVADQYVRRVGRPSKEWVKLGKLFIRSWLTSTARIYIKFQQIISNLNNMYIKTY